MTEKHQDTASGRPWHSLGWRALLPMLLFIVAYLGLGVALGDFYKVPLPLAFVLVSAVALLQMRGGGLEARLSVYSRGAADSNLLLMVWIFVLAGAFASSAKQMGAIDAVVQLTLSVAPPNALLAGLFVASCIISISVGTSVGTVVALVPIASGLADGAGLPVALFVAAVVGGAFFGDNLSFISDTTVAATRTQGCRMKDKFRTNIRIVWPAALLTLGIYVAIGSGASTAVAHQLDGWWKVVPYLLVLFIAVMGVNVLVSLMTGLAATLVIGLADGSYGLAGWMEAVGQGIGSMGELIIVSLMAGGLLEVVKASGGIDMLLRAFSRRINGRRGAEASIVGLVGLTNVCTANNTVAILAVGSIVRHVAERYRIPARRAASLLDTMSCCVQGFLPYGAQLLMASGLAAVAPADIIPWLFYPMTLVLCVLLSIIFVRSSGDAPESGGDDAIFCSKA